MDTSELQKIKQRYNIVGNSDGLNHALDVALQVAPTDLSVLIIGESGVGKEIIPRVIHDNSPRRREKYFAINCGSIPEGTIDSELFGHEKGSFTGAIGESEGYFGIANKGTIFLDEVGELPIQTQARLLRVLETGEYIRVGGTEIRKTDVRIVAATNVNMRKAVSEGRFREDLLYRISVVPLTIPPLRERKQDIPGLVLHFVEQFAQRYDRHPQPVSPEELRRLCEYDWPGNVRELKNVIERAVILNNAGPLDFALGKTPAAPRPADSASFLDTLEDTPTLSELEERYLRRIMERTEGRVRGPEGAETLLRIKRSTLYAKLKKYGIPCGSA